MIPIKRSAPEKGQTIMLHADENSVLHLALGCEGIVSKRLGSIYRSGKCKDWVKFKNPAAPAVKREAERTGARSGGDDRTDATRYRMRSVRRRDRHPSDGRNA
jgi:ATP-dependent DNA ligase